MSTRWANIMDQAIVTVVNLDNWTHEEAVLPGTMLEFMESAALRHNIPLERLSLTFGLDRLTAGMHSPESCGIEAGVWVHIRDTRRITLFCTDTEGSTSLFELPPSLKTSVFQLRLSSIFGVRPEHQVLSFGGRIMFSARTLESYGIGDESTVHLALRMIGGTEDSEEEAPSEHNEDLFFDDHDYETDDTASQNSIESENSDSSTLYNHRAARVREMVDEDFDSQATTLEWGGLFEPEEDEIRPGIDTNPANEPDDDHGSSDGGESLPIPDSSPVSYPTGWLTGVGFEEGAYL